MNDHPCKKIAIKSAEVDELMVPLINWLNAFESIYTTFCCQGDPFDSEKSQEENKYYAPYVSFFCTNQIDLICVLSTLRCAAEVQVMWNSEKGFLEYVARFGSQQSMLDTIKYINDNNEALIKRMSHAY